MQANASHRPTGFQHVKLNLLSFLLVTPLFLSVPPVAAADKAAPTTVSEKEKIPEGKLIFDGKTLNGWKVTEFAGKGEVRVEKGELQLNTGDSLTGVTWTNEPPKMPYEISLEAMKVEGSDFFCGLTFPYEKSNATLIVGGWGGSVVGISSIDGQSASENDTTKYLGFDKKKWYAIRLRVTSAKIEAWIDKEKVVDFETENRKITMRSGEIELNTPLGFAAWQTTAALRNIRLVELPKQK